MNRRKLLKNGCGLLVAGPFLGQLAKAVAAEGTVPYTREVYEEALASGKPFMLDFYATW